MSDSGATPSRVGAAKRSFAKSTPRERITQVVEGWFLTEPLMFAVWTMHDIIARSDLATIRVGRGRIEFNPNFVSSLRRDQLRSVLAFEAMRILLGHPYSRRQPRSDISYQASNLTVQECLRTTLPIPRPREVFGDERYDDQYFEFYYRELVERAGEEPDDNPPDQQSDDQQEPGDQGQQKSDDQEDDGQEPSETQGSEGTPVGIGESDSGAGDSREPSESSTQAGSDQQAANDLKAYSDPSQVGVENTGDWDNDDLQRDEINAAVREAAESDGWGTIAGSAKEQLLAALHPKMDYRGVLRNFRQSVLSVRRRLTRMKPSRRYGFDQMGSRYDFTTKLLFAVDVSGSMGSRDLQLGFSVVSRFFRYGVESIDVIWFDEKIQSEPLTLRRARTSFNVTGRGGTNFSPVIQYIDQHRGYDGLIIFTDGYAPVPRKPKNGRTRILWLFKNEATFLRMDPSLGAMGRSAFLQESSR
jgi:predicted metal-dependent peptidase